MTLFPSMNMLSQCLFISTKTQVFVQINVLIKMATTSALFT